MRDVLSRIIELQSEYNASNTPAMNLRGKLIRGELRGALERLSDQLASVVGIDPDDLIIEGRDGTGQKSKVPWTRFGSKSRAPSANSGWYVVFLFRPQGDGVYLCLSHAATVWNGMDYVPRPKDEMIPLMNWARELLTQKRAQHQFVENIDLAAVNPLASSYEKSTALAKLYQMDELPTDEELSDDLLLFGELLGRIYDLEDKGRSPNEAYHEREGVQSEIRDIQRGHVARGRSQGFGLTAPERKAVEMRAMHLASSYLKAEGYRIKDVSAKESCDYLAFKNRVKTYVEVKGTTGLGATVNLTKNEVALHQARYPNTMLLIVSRIDLDKVPDPPIATGSILKTVHPWRISTERLTALSYQYAVEG